jgi:hypothetical protein
LWIGTPLAVTVFVEAKGIACAARDRAFERPARRQNSQACDEIPNTTEWGNVLTE